MKKLPIDAILADIVEAAKEEGAAIIVEASPGSGKTTRIPPALSQNARVVVVEPRRLAAIAAAKRVAEEFEKNLGKDVGYRVRLDNKADASCPLVYVTPGILINQLVAEIPAEKTIFVFDEFHERGVECDLALAILLTLKERLDSDLRIVVMSATLDCDALAHYLGKSQIFRCHEHLFPTHIVYRDSAGESYSDNIAKNAVAALESVIECGDGDILIFVPGVAEITAGIRECERRFPNTEILPLHASLPLDEQKKCLRASTARRIIWSTNVAESSVTIPNLGIVIDTGLEKTLFYDSDSGLNRLELRRIGKQSATQRAGRAGRLRNGICVRLWSEALALDTERSPEIRRRDMSDVVLKVKMWGLSDLESLRWLDRPTPEHIEAAIRFLIDIHALDPSGELTARGRQLATIPLEARLCAFLMSASERGVLKRACAAAIFLSEAPYRRSMRDLYAGADFWTSFKLFEKNLRRFEHGDHRFYAESVNKLYEDAQRLFNSSDENKSEQALALALSDAYPDRVAVMRERSSHEKNKGVRYLMTGHRGVLLSEKWEDARLILCVDTELGKRGANAESPVVKALILREDMLELQTRRIVRYLPDKDRVSVTEAQCFRDLIVKEHPIKGETEDKSRILEEAAKENIEKAFDVHADSAEALRRRLRFVNAQGASFPDLDENFIAEHLPFLCAGKQSFAQLRDIDLAAYYLERLEYGMRKTLERLAPARLELPSGKFGIVDYASDPPALRAKIQHFFGLRTLPRIYDGKIALLLHLCAPNGRVEQVTGDIDNLWSRTYPMLRKELRGRYPKHDWPEKAP